MKQFLLVFLFVVVACFIGCDEKNQKQPDYLISEENMVDIMVDMHLVETVQNLKLITPDTTNTNYKEFFESIYKTHGVSKTAFDSSLFYYTSQSEQMNIIYDKVLERLYELESEVNSQ